MAKVIDITEKLAFDEKPAVVIRGRSFQVNDDAKTVLEIMGDFENKSEKAAIMTALGRLFSEDDKNDLIEKLRFKDLVVVVESAMSLVIGENDEDTTAGEAETHTTTW